MKAVIIGCGNIAASYAADLRAAGVVEIAGFHDISAERAHAFAAEHGGVAFEGLDDAIDAAELVINLTIFEAHYPVSKAALVAGRHVYSEKPLALSLENALELADLSKQQGVRLAAAPFTFLGEAQRTALDWLGAGKIGTVRLAYAEVNHGRIEAWHPNPPPFYAAGPMLDVGVYPLTIMTVAFGPVTRLDAHASTLLAERRDITGAGFSPASPDYWLVELEHASGAKVRLTANFYVKGHEGIEFHGDEGSLFLDSWFVPGARLEHTPYGGKTRRVPVPDAPRDHVDWSAGVAELVEAIGAGRESLLNRERSVHLVEILDAVNRSAATGLSVELETSFASS